MEKLDNYFKYFTQRKQEKGVVGQEVSKGFRREAGDFSLSVGRQCRPTFVQGQSGLPSKTLSLSKGGW